MITPAEEAEMRAVAESIMVDTWQVTGPGEGEPVFNEETLEYDPPAPVVIYDGLGRLKSQNTDVQVSDAGSQLIGEQESLLSFPVASSTGIRRDQIAECTAVHPIKGDPDMVGVKVRIKGPSHQTFASARRFRVEEVS